MSERNWTTAQRNAIETRDKTLLVSAAAGSGKTAVLTERIIRSLTDEENPADISRMLIVTFTRAAATQLRQKISTALSKRLALDPRNTHLSRQLMMLSSAHISTIDSFYMDVVKANFQASGLTPTFRMADESELIALRREIMNDIIDQMYERTPNFSALSDIFCDIKNEDSLCSSLLDIAKRLEQLPESVGILRRSADTMNGHAREFLCTEFGRVWLRTVTEFAETGVSLFTAALTEMASEEHAVKLESKYGPRYREMLARCREILHTVKSHNKEYGREIREDHEVDRFDRHSHSEEKKSAELRKQSDRLPNTDAFYTISLYSELQMLLTAPLESEIDRSRPKASEEFIKRRDLCDQFFKKWKKNAPVWGANSVIDITESAEKSAEMLSLLHETLTLYQKEYTAAKRSREIAEFSDVSRAAYNMLVDKNGKATPLAKEIADSFDAVYIDEYQDVNAMQDATFRAISKERNRFMVGDIKQSIYRFRGAQPKVFANYRKQFPLLEKTAEKTAEATVFMSNCFRCDQNVIRFSNAVSGFLFSRGGSSIGYTAADDLVFSKDPQKSGNKRCEVLLLETLSAAERGKKTEGAVLEAQMIAEEIAALLENGKKADGSSIRAGDIAVLARNATHFPHISKALSARGIPVNDTSKQSFFENPEVLCMYSLLVTIDNPLRDVHLAAALRSPFFGFTLNDLITLRAAGGSELSLYEALCLAAKTGELSQKLSQKTADFLTRIATYREKARTLPVDKLLRYLYRDTAVAAFAGYEKSDNGTVIRRMNLNRLYEYARKFESGSFKGLYQFIRYVDNIMQSDAKLPQPEGKSDAVLLSTIHGSKGLEFPICFLTSAQSAFSKNDFSQTLLFDEQLGCALRLSSAGPFSRYDTFFRSAIEMELRRQSLEEEMRILYVGMTRAVEKLYVTAALQGKAETALKNATLQATENIGEFAFGNSYLDWILAALERPDAEDFAIIRCIEEASLGTKQAPPPEPDLISVPLVDDSPSAAEKTVKEIKQRFDFIYPYEHLTRLPAKLSVSRLSPVALDVYDHDITPLPSAEESENTERLLRTFDRSPVFGKKTADAAERGTATHEFLQFCDFERAEREGVTAELRRLIDHRFLPEEAKDAVRTEELEFFFKSDLYHALKNASSLHREVRFHLFLPASEFTEDPAFAEKLKDEKLAVQGVIDLFFTDAEGRLILCDYKTDRLTPYELSHPDAATATLAARHGSQLSYYARALREICGHYPDRILIYSLPLGKALDIALPK